MGRISWGIFMKKQEIRLLERILAKVGGMKREDKTRPLCRVEIKFMPMAG